MKPYVELDCDNTDIIASKILSLVKNKLNAKDGWLFIDTIDVLKNVPELLDFFKTYKLYVKHAAVTILRKDFPLHIDVAPTIAKINFPILNTEGWVNKWFNIDEEALANCPFTVDEFGAKKEDIKLLPSSAFTLAGELYDFKKPIIFNSRIGHSVIKLNPKEMPRVVASFTFFNEPIDFLK